MSLLAAGLCLAAACSSITAVITDLKRRTYDLRVVHAVEGGQRTEYNLTVSVIQ